MKSFRPPFRPQKKKNWFMLKQGLNCNFNFYIVKNWSASWWPNLVTNIVFDLMGLLWDVCWPHWPNLAKIRRPPSVRSVSLTTGLAVKYLIIVSSSLKQGPISLHEFLTQVIFLFVRSWSSIIDFTKKISLSIIWIFLNISIKKPFLRNQFENFTY